MYLNSLINTGQKCYANSPSSSLAVNWNTSGMMIMLKNGEIKVGKKLETRSGEITVTVLKAKEI